MAQLFDEAQGFYGESRATGSGMLHDAFHLQAAPDGSRAVFTGAFMLELRGTAKTKVFEIDLHSNAISPLTDSDGGESTPKYSPDGRCIAFIRRNESGATTLEVHDQECRADIAVAAPCGTIEYFDWAPGGGRILLGVAPPGCDVAGAQGGGGSSRLCAEPTEAWRPIIEGEQLQEGRSLWVFELQEERLWRVQLAACSVWEAVWCGDEAVAAVVSDESGEGAWYRSELRLIDLESGRSSRLRAPEHQMGCLAGSPSGRYVAFVEALCSDRLIVAGDLRIADLSTGEIIAVSTRRVDITSVRWCSPQTVLLAGHRGFESVVLNCNAANGEVIETWASDGITTAGIYFDVSPVGCNGDCLLIGEGFRRPPEIAQIVGGEYGVRLRLHPAGAGASSLGTAEQVAWTAADGLELQGLLLRPLSAPPWPTIMYVHGGPIWHWRPMWLGRSGAAVDMLLARGFAAFLPNPRGSSGRGQEFSAKVRGDMGGADLADLLAGLDWLVEAGLSDRERLAVTGNSYGGFMAALLVAKDDRFKASIPVVPMVNYVTQRLLSNIPDFVEIFVDGRPDDPGGDYHRLSVTSHVDAISTPVMTVCGGADRSAPAEEAIQLHRALLRAGKASVLVTYPQEGHGIRGLPAASDYAARSVDWFMRHLGERHL